MRVRSSLFVATVLLNLSCSTNKQFGESSIEKNSDTVSLKKEIQKIKGLDKTAFEARSFTGKEKIEIKYRFFKPKFQNTKYPLVIVFHGSGSIGTDNTSQLGLLAKLFAGSEIQKNYPAYILAPQFPTRSSDYKMDTVRNVLYSTPRPCLNSVLQLIDSLKSNPNIDTKRIYAVGFSMGASTVINALSARPDLFAAGISISGIPEFDKNLKTIPIWLIHGTEDTENPINSDQQFYKEMNGKIRFWTLKSVAHNDVFTNAILGETLPEWLFKQHKK